MAGSCRDDEHIYYNAKLFNNTGMPILAQLNDQRASAVLQRACDYRCSIIRFSVNGSLLPLLVPRMLPAAPVPTTAYSLTLSSGASSFVQPVLFTAPQNNQIRFAYYYFNAFLDDLNAAFAAAYVGLAALAGPLPAPQAPVMIWNPQTQLFTLAFNDSYVGAITISMNYELFNLFQSFQVVFNGYNTPLGRDYDLIITRGNTISAVSPGSLSALASALTPPILELQQEFSSLSNWSPVATFYFTSYQIPVRNENIPTTTSNGQSFNVSNNSLPIITDFEPILGSDAEFNRGQTQYLPSAQYRYLTLESDSTLSTVDLQCFWTDKAGESFPLLLDLGYYMSVKILFEKIR